MNILMVTNTYLPFVGGVERSVEIFANEYRRYGHKVIIIAPTFQDSLADETDIIRVPALQNFNGTDFSLQLPIPGLLNAALNDFKPDIVHSHHPFMMGDSALRIAAQFRIPIVYTFHTYYESYTHYVPGDSPALKRFVTALVTGYANLCDWVFAPSNSVAIELRKRGVETNIDIIPTGIELELFSIGDGKSFRKQNGIPPDVFVFGFVSRIAPEKNITFLINSMIKFLSTNIHAHFLMIGTGSLCEHMCETFNNSPLKDRFHYVGLITGKELIDAYHSMDAFVFASKTETQGLVLVEAMACGLPVIALDGPAVNEIVNDFANGRLVLHEDENEFCNALDWCFNLNKKEIKKIQLHSKESASNFSKEKCANKALEIYTSLLSKKYQQRDQTDSSWAKAIRLIKAEFELLKNLTKATSAAIDLKNPEKNSD